MASQIASQIVSLEDLVSDKSLYVSFFRSKNLFLVSRHYRVGVRDISSSLQWCRKS